MAKGILSTKSRIPQSTTAICSPVSERPDAQPRNDFQDLNNGATKNRPPNQAHWDFQRPRTSEGRQQNKKPQPNGSGFDFRIAVPPAEAVPSPVESEKGHGENMIGIALGSPRMVETQNVMSQMQEKAINTVSDTKKSPPIQRKPSKWKKIGGLFKAKSAITSSTNQPFYQVRSDNEWPLQGSSHSIDYQAQPKSEPQTKPISNTEVWPCLESDTQSKPHPKNSTPSSDQNADQKKPNLGPLLQVDIPDVQMERYSVMFGGLLGKDQPAPSDRRSKTMEDIEAPKAQDPPASPEFPPPPRRATSPTRSKSPSPSFTLFPSSKVSKASKILGSQNLPRGPSPLHRSQTSMAETRRGSAATEKDHVLLMVHSPPAKSSSHGPQDSVSSFLSSTSIGSDDETFMLQRLKSIRSYVDPKGEPEWEILNKKSPTNESKPKLAQALTINTQELPPPEPADNDSASSSPILTPLNAARDPGCRIISPSGSKPAFSPAESARMPLGDDNKDLHATETFDAEPMDTIPTVEVSIARSVSVSRGKKQTIVPIKPRADRLTPDERLMVRRARTPQVTDAHYGHRHGNSQDVRIESV
ncbi:hypothetical protein P170DRAFT_415726 [Aspergillus steynii IBT 23096]|uniref:Uncharacterized protein n=1 Tax=Aspergillus steynii IBT 23096 TaxID=1392250 RepID=A0A2I2FWF4_9EURO|nr:uncharacterized protein P170DRAFT_415726 [Aspergillus steynii IBT 23096]PLB44896.1 hypothetical protein P170DRAFT_415726 [Aspergillus steynii IBT 23096]